VQQGKERAGHAHDARDVRREDILRVLAGELVSGRVAADDPGVVDEGVDAALVRLDVGRGILDGDIVGHVDRDEAHAETAGGGLAALGVPGADDHLVAQSGQPAGGLVAEALVGPVMKVMVVMNPASARPRQAARDASTVGKPVPPRCPPGAG